MSIAKKRKKILPNGRELSMVCWQLSQMCRAGISWQDSVLAMQEGANPPSVKELLVRMLQPLQEGQSLLAAMEKAMLIPPYMLRMVAAGQASGRLEQVLLSLSVHYRREYNTATTIISAVTYPAVMGAILALVFLVLALGILPIFAKTVAQIGVGLTPIAGMFLTGAWGKWAAVAISCSLFIAAATLLMQFRGGKIEIFYKGRAGTAFAQGRVASTMGMMLQSGLSMEESVGRAVQLLEGTSIEEKMRECGKSVENGKPFAKAAEEVGIFCGMHAGLLSAGFRTGNPELALEEIAQQCQSQGEELLAAAVGRFEYALVIGLCLAVGLVLMSVMLPLIGALSAIGA